MDASFRLATPRDMPELLALMGEYYRYDGLDFDPERARAALESLLSDPRLGEVWAITDGGQAGGGNTGGEVTVGYIALTWGFSLESGGRDAFVDELCLREAFRGRGIGTAAIRHGIARCRALGITALRLEATERNVRAQRLYRRLGFEDHRRHLMTFPL